MRRPAVELDRIAKRILMLRGEKVMLSHDLAELYEVETRALVQAVKRNAKRFPEDFMFQLTPEEALRLSMVVPPSRSQSVILNEQGAPRGRASRSQNVILKRGQNVKYLPYAFTEQGVAMLSSVLRSDRAVQVNIAIMRAFVKLRDMLASHRELARKLATLEKKYDARFRVVFEAINELMAEAEKPPRRRIGFTGGNP